MPHRMTFLYAGLRVRDLARELRFYRAIGFRVKARGTMEHGGRWVQMLHGRSPQRLELNFYPRSNRFWTPWSKGTEFDHLGFYVDDVDHWFARLVRLGAGVALRPITEGRSRLAYLKDPEGNWVEIFGPAPVARPKKRPKPKGRGRRRAN